MEIKKEKKIHLEILRVLCIVLVIFNHTAPDGFLAFIGETNGFLYLLKLFLSILCKIAVPVFFMISGALLLSREEPLRVLFFKRILRMVLVLVLVSVPYYIMNAKDAPASVGGFFRTLFTSAATTSMWYLYAYIGFLIMLPFLRAIVRALKDREYLYLLFAHILFTVSFTVLDKFVFVQGHNPDFSIAIILESNIFYPLMGYYVENVMDKSRLKKRNYWIAGILSVLSILAAAGLSVLYYKVHAGALDIDSYQSCFEVLLCVPSISLYFIIKGIVRIRTGGFWYCFFSRLGGAVFGVYLIEPLLRRLFTKYVFGALVPLVGSFVSAIALVIVVAVAGLAVICLLKSIPFLKRIVNYFI